MSVSLSSLWDGVFLNLNRAINCWATFAASLRDGSHASYPHSRTKRYADAHRSLPGDIVIICKAVH